MISRSLLGFIAAVTLGGATAAFARDAVVTSTGVTVLRVTSGTPGLKVRFRGVLLLAGQPMRLVEQSVRGS
jgi:hypothetical protein